MIADNKNERTRLLSDHMNDGRIRIQDLSISAEWRPNQSNLSIKYSDAYVLSDGSLGETAESSGIGSCRKTDA